ncbi:MAG TPA: ShlB/FhaC/HecB family hemolysin secretion/activation protein, partial [Caulobacteraceae bacterium]|nr:ShlB/FhaC/HecB family hemolysin secretion/activation protein [Caulobacteraceae bacterium]
MAPAHGDESWVPFRSIAPSEATGDSSPKRLIPIGLAALVLASTAAPALAQQAPDAGTLLREQPRPVPPPVEPAAPLTLGTPAVQPEEAGQRVRVSGIRVTGATLIPADELAAQLRPLVGGEHSLTDLQRGALTLIAYYAQRGYLARVLLPPQEIKDGIVEYRVVEGARAELKIDNRGQRIETERVQRFIDARLPVGEPFDLRALGDAVNILNQQPGAQVSATLAPGKGEHDVDVFVDALDRPLFSYQLGANNHGSEGSGVAQGMAAMTVANPTGRFDSLSLLVNASEGAAYGRVEYGLAVGDRGLRLGVNASRLAYKLVQADLADLDASGSAVSAGLTFSYPLALRTIFGLGLTGSVSGQRFVDRAAGVETSNRTNRVASLGLAGYRIQSGGLFAGLQTFGADVIGGNVGENDADTVLGGGGGSRTEGGFAKLAWNTGLTRAVASGWMFDALARGQFATRNLDSSQQFSLGGPAGVRGYPLAEGSGDDGWIASSTLSRRFGPNWRIGGFVDVGGIRVEHSPLAGGPRPNSYTLGGAGALLDWRITPRAVLTATAAAPI